MLLAFPPIVERERAVEVKAYPTLRHPTRFRGTAYRHLIGVVAIARRLQGERDAWQQNAVALRDREVDAQARAQDAEAEVRELRAKIAEIRAANDAEDGDAYNAAVAKLLVADATTGDKT